MGGIILDQSDPFYVHRNDSTAVVYNVQETDDTREAAAGLIETLASAVPSVVVVDYRTASVLVFSKERLQAA